MKKTAITIGFVAALGAAGALAATGEATITGTTEGSDISGAVTLEDTKKGLKISATLENVPPGKHGFHIHQFGSCADSGKAAGDHYNPKKKPHGNVIEDGIGKAHGGDLGNVEIGDDGKGTVDVTVEKLSLQGRYGVAGRAFVLHASPDDFGQPTGNAGGRIGCGTIALTGE